MNLFKQYGYVIAIGASGATTSRRPRISRPRLA
jgi:hypothetical protein